MFTVPAPTLFTLKLFEPPPAVTFPVILTIPPKLFKTAGVVLELAPTEQFPVMFNVPVELFLMPATKSPPPVLLLVMFPTMDAEFGDAALKFKRVTFDLEFTFAVSVTPEFNTNVPVPSFEISVQVALAVMVMVCPVAARPSSPTVGTTPPTHVAPALKLPLAADTMSAMIKVLSRRCRIGGRLESRLRLAVWLRPIRRACRARCRWRWRLR